MDSTNVIIIRKEMQRICNCDSKCVLTEFEGKILLHCQERIKGEEGRRIEEELAIALLEKKNLKVTSNVEGVLVIS
ncbi:MAG: hypothetical protein OIF32_10660 [Campylobacterales bacterium]|nr:hypothetical protein [Campylobacterales bacterium]